MVYDELVNTFDMHMVYRMVYRVYGVKVTKLVEIWEHNSQVHILRRHAGLDMLNREEYGVEEEIEEEE